MKHGAIRLALAAALLTCGGTALASAAGPTITIGQGTLTGLAGAGVVQFLGIPYAAPPVGSLRWRPPAAALPWSSTLNATAYAPACPQELRGNTAESCLFLNVTAPAAATATSNLPVMVWIHGGGFISGSGADFDPTALVTDGNVVAVTINYRLGYFGFLAHPALSAADPNGVSGNYGLLDQQAALAWVRANIAAFGGNPARITIFGESAGGQSVVDQLISPSAGKLAGAIIQSGAYEVTLPTLAAAETAGTAAASTLGCPDQTAACLYALSAATIANALNPLSSLGSVNPVIDGLTLPEQPASAFYDGHFQHIPVINGGNHDELRLFTGLSLLFGGTALTAAQYLAQVENDYGSAAPTVLADYPLSAYGGSAFAPSYASDAIGTDTVFACHSDMIGQLLAQYTAVYQYELNDPNAPTESGPVIAGFSYGSAHSSDLSYIFPAYFVPFHPGPAVLSQPQTIMAKAMRQYWASLAHYGRPLAPQGSTWPAFNAASALLMEFTPPAGAARASFYTGHHCDYWKAGQLAGAGLPAGAPY